MIEVEDQNSTFIKQEIKCKEALLERVSNSTRDSFIDFSSHPGARQMRLPSVSQLKWVLNAVGDLSLSRLFE